MSSRSFVQLVLAVCFTLLLPLTDLVILRDAKRYTSGALRLRFYRWVITYAWLTCAAAAIALGPAWPSAFHQPSPTWVRNGFASGTVACTLAAFLFLNFRVGLRAARSAKARQVLTRALFSVRFFLPVSRQERRWFAAISLTAGICEEFLYRGYLMQLLHSSLGLTVLVSFLISAAAFGLAHLYQGIRGMLQTALAGVVFGLLALLSRGLWLPMTIHALLDLQMLFMYQPLRDSPDLAMRLISGADPRTADGLQSA